MTDEKTIRVFNQIIDFEKDHVLLLGNINDFFYEENINKNEAKEIVRLIQENGISINNAEKRFLYNQIKICKERPSMLCQNFGGGHNN